MHHALRLYPHRQRPDGLPRAVLARTRELVEFAQHHGFGRDELIQINENLP
ncbi:MAG: hypothetical protein ABJB47_12665 [Actinomycetota bacterium]